MKLYITARADTAPEGYEVCPVVYGNIDLTNIPDNSCTEVVAIESIDFTARDQIQDFLKKVVSKLRSGAITTIVGIDMHELGRRACHRIITADEFNNIINERLSISPASEILDVLRQHGLSIVSYKTVQGMSYEIKAARK